MIHPIPFLTLPALSNAAFEDFHARLSRLLDEAQFNHPALAALVADYLRLVSLFALSIRRMRSSPLTRLVRRADRKRKKWVRSVALLLRLGLNSDDPEVVEAAEKLGVIYADYRRDAVNQMGARSEQIRALIENLTADDYFAMAQKAGLLPALTALEQANDEFFEIYAERYRERESRPEQGLNSRKLRLQIVRTARECIGTINGVIIGINLGGESAEEGPKLAALGSDVSALVRQYRLVNANQRRRRAPDVDQQIREGAGEVVAARRLEAEGLARIARGEAAKLAAAEAAAEEIIARSEAELARDNAPLTKAEAAGPKRRR